MVKVIFACVYSAGRSQLAAAFFNQLADHDKAEAVWAGTEPGLRVHPEVLAAMQQVGIDLSNAKPQSRDHGCLGQEVGNHLKMALPFACLRLPVDRSSEFCPVSR